MTDLRVKIARDLRAIEDMYTRLRAEAINRASDPLMPGGEAMVMLGPSADVEAFGYMQMSAIMGRIDADAVAAAVGGDIEPPLSYLASWSDIVREERSQPPGGRASIKREVAYLRGALDWMTAIDEDGAPWFLPVEDFADGLRKVRLAMENVLKEGERHDRGVSCMDCGTALVKVWGDDVESDQWHCRPCGTWSTHDQYWQAVRADYLKRADRLTATDMLEQYRIKPGTLTGWATKGLVRKRGRDDSGRQLYDVADALKQRDGKEVA